MLENMHCMLVVQLIRKHGFGFLIDPAPSTSDNGPQRFDTRGFRNVLYSSILATDMSLHFAWMQSLEDFEGQVSSGLGIYDYKNGTRGQGVARDEKVESDRILIAQAIIKCADISNPVSRVDLRLLMSGADGDRPGRLTCRSIGRRYCSRNGRYRRLWRRTSSCPCR